MRSNRTYLHRMHGFKNISSMMLLFATLLMSLPSHAAPTVNGLFYGDGDESQYVLYNTSIGGSKLWYTQVGNRLYVALVVDRSVNDNVFSPKKPKTAQPYTTSAGWTPAHSAKSLTDSEFAQFTLTVGDTVFDWKQGYADQTGDYNNTLPTWYSSETAGAGSGTPPPDYASSSSFVWNLNNYANNSSPNWNMNVFMDANVYKDDIEGWKSPFDPASPDTVPGLEGYPVSGPLGFSSYYQWEWSMVYEWSVDLSSFGSSPIYVISGSSHHSPAKNDAENDVFPDPPGSGYLSDYGDLPESYGTLLADDCARHYVVPNGAFLGLASDPEPDGLPGVLARGDDNSASDDEDGVVLLTPMIPGSQAVIRVTAGTAGYLSAFIDWDDSGSLNPVTLVSAAGPVPVGAGTLSDILLATNGVYDLTIQVPDDATGVLPARFRYTNLSGQGGGSATGLAETGEVEDHIFTSALGDRVFADFNNNGVWDAGEGIAGVDVTLQGDIDGDGSSDAVTIQTGADGYYLFDDLRASVSGVSYSVSVDASDLPAGLTLNTVDPDAVNSEPGDNTSQVLLTLASPPNLDQDFGYRSPALYSISGQVRDDFDKDGQFSDPDLVVGGVLVQLYSDPNGDGDPADGVVLASAKTLADGSYIFEDLIAGNYVVMETDPVSSVSTADIFDANDNMITVAIVNSNSTNNDFLDAIDPAGYFYDVTDGRIVSGGLIQVSGVGAKILMDGSSGQYSFISTNPVATTFTITVTPPPGYIIDPTRPAQSGVFDPTGGTNTIVLGSYEYEDEPNHGYLVNYSAESNTYYYAFSLEKDDPLIINNNFPLVIDTGTLSTEISLKPYASADGKVMIEISTVNENGNNDIEIYAMIDDQWALVANVPSTQIQGYGSHSYTVETTGLTPGESYYFKVLDEAGHIFESPDSITVALPLVPVAAISLNAEYVEMIFQTEPWKYYQLKITLELGAAAEWTTEYTRVEHPFELGVWMTAKKEFTGAPGQTTTKVRVFRNHKRAFFKAVKLD